jgi:DNA/RNA-binding domain of Phe-tRNA-synthetase-like protein
LYFRHVPEIWQRFPQLVPGLLVVKGIDPGVEVESQIRAWYERAGKRLADQTESEMPEVAAWRRVYSQMGLKPTKYRSASEALLRRFKREGDLPRLHPLVDLCNAVSLAYALPVAVFDLERVEQFIEVRPASGTEQYLSFQEQIEHPEAEEIVFADAAGHAHARRWTFRQSRRSVVEQDTAKVVIVSEGVHETAGKDIPSLLDELVEAIGKLWGNPEKQAILTADRPRIDFDL